MKSVIVAAAIAGVAVAMPAETSQWEGYTTTTTTKTSTWEPYTTTTATWSEYKDTTTTWEPMTTKATTWSEYKDNYKCTTKTETYTTSECGDKTSAWDNCKAVTKTKYTPDEKCTWSVYSTNTWAPMKEKCTYYSAYTTTECGDKTSAWDNCKVATKTSTWYKDEDKCSTTWAPVYTTKASTWSEIKASTTWSEVKASSTWMPVSEVKASSTWATAKVAQYTGAANKETFGKAAVAIAAVAMML